LSGVLPKLIRKPVTGFVVTLFSTLVTQSVMICFLLVTVDVPASCSLIFHKLRRQYIGFVKQFSTCQVSDRNLNLLFLPQKQKTSKQKKQQAQTQSQL